MVPGADEGGFCRHQISWTAKRSARSLADLFSRVQTKRRKNHTDPNVKQSPETHSRGPRLTFRSLVTAQTTATPTETCMIPFSDVGGSTTDQELPTRPQKKARAARISARGPPSARAAPHQRARPPISAGGRAGRPGLAAQNVSLPTFGVVPADSFPDQRLPLPEGDPQEVVGPTADLDCLPRGVHEGPR